MRLARRGWRMAMLPVGGGGCGGVGVVSIRRTAVAASCQPAGAGSAHSRW